LLGVINIVFYDHPTIIIEGVIDQRTIAFAFGFGFAVCIEVAELDIVGFVDRILIVGQTRFFAGQLHNSANKNKKACYISVTGLEMCFVK